MLPPRLSLEESFRKRERGKAECFMLSCEVHVQTQTSPSLGRWMPGGWGCRGREERCVVGDGDMSKEI